MTAACQEQRVLQSESPRECKSICCKAINPRNLYVTKHAAIVVLCKDRMARARTFAVPATRQPIVAKSARRFIAKNTGRFVPLPKRINRNCCIFLAVSKVCNLLEKGFHGFVKQSGINKGDIALIYLFNHPFCIQLFVNARAGDESSRHHVLRQLYFSWYVLGAAVILVSKKRISHLSTAFHVERVTSETTASGRCMVHAMPRIMELMTNMWNMSIPSLQLQ